MEYNLDLFNLVNQKNPIFKIIKPWTVMKQTILFGKTIKHLCICQKCNYQQYFKIGSVHKKKCKQCIADKWQMLKTGTKVGCWIILDEITYDKNGYPFQVCSCVCETQKTFRYSVLKNWHLNNDAPECYHVNKSYRFQDPPTLTAWRNMKERCDNPKSAAYLDYGGRGIKYCERWKEFKNFVYDMGVCPKGYSIERLDHEKNYSKSNCIWIHKSLQSANRRSTEEDRAKKAFQTLKDIVNIAFS